jgi:hypothetical protein
MWGKPLRKSHTHEDAAAFVGLIQRTVPKIYNCAAENYL